MDKLNCVFFGSFLYPKGYAGTKRIQQFLDYIVDKGDQARVILFLKLAKGSKMNENKGIYKDIPFEVLGPDVKIDLLLPLKLIHITFLTCVKFKHYKRIDSKNIIVSYGISIENIIPLAWAKIIGYKILVDIVEDNTTINKFENNRHKIKYMLSNMLMKHILKYISGISVISDHLLKKVSDYKIPIKKIPISASNINMEYKKIKSEWFKILYAGTYGEKEGLDSLFKAFGQIKSRYNNVKLVLTGNCPGKIRLMLKEIISDQENIIFTGYLTDQDYYETLANADVLMVTRTDSEYANAGFPYKLGEYLATGNPVICTNVSDIATYLEDKVSALIVPPDDIDSIADAIVYVINNPEEARKIGLQGKEICNKYFNPDINSKMFYDLLKSV